jgi:hypothetical protein
MTIAAGATFTPSQPYTRFDRGSGACKGQTEGGDSDAVFLLEEGATLSRVVIGANQAEGVHCLGSCTLDHVYFEVRLGESELHLKVIIYIPFRMFAKMLLPLSKAAAPVTSTTVVQRYVSYSL